MTLIDRGMIINGPVVDDTTKLSALATIIGVTLPIDGTAAKFTLVGAGGGGQLKEETPNQSTLAKTGSGGGAGGTAIWFGVIYADDTVTLGSGGVINSDATGSTAYISLQDGINIVVHGGKVGTVGDMGGAGGAVLINENKNNRPVVSLTGSAGGGGFARSPNDQSSTSFTIGGLGGSSSLMYAGSGGNGQDLSADGSIVNATQGNNAILIIEW